MLGYCKARVGGQRYGNEWSGGHRCPRLAVVWIGDRDNGKALCAQHAKRERDHADVRV